MCVERRLLEEEFGTWNGVKNDDLLRLYRFLKERGEFRNRENVETDPTYIQLVTWIVVQRYDRLWVMQRPVDVSEPRMDSSWRLGVREHVSVPDGTPPLDPVAWATRHMWGTTVTVDRNCRAHLAGALIDQGTEVGKFHMGLIFFVGLQRGLPEINPDLNVVGSFHTVDSLRRHSHDLDDWSRLIMAALSSGSLTSSLPGDRLLLNANRHPRFAEF